MEVFFEPWSRGPVCKNTKKRTGFAAIPQLSKKWLFGVGATDPLTFSAVTLLLIGVALIACWIPARRATKVDSLVVLRLYPHSRRMGAVEILSF
jgi:hypothetical protein